VTPGDGGVLTAPEGTGDATADSGNWATASLASAAADALAAAGGASGTGGASGAATGTAVRIVVAFVPLIVASSFVSSVCVLWSRIVLFTGREQGAIPSHGRALRAPTVCAEENGALLGLTGTVGHVSGRSALGV
jgi:hypothetical protein